MTDTSAVAIEEAATLGIRATRTRDAIVEAARALFLDRGYAGTRVSNITDACGISRAGFYTYFKDKREIFTLIGAATYRDVLDIIERWSAIPSPCSDADIEAWVRAYFDFLDVHGAFIFSSTHSAPDDEQFRTEAVRLQMRVAWLLGTALREHQADPTDVPEALGLTVVSLLDRSWYQCRMLGLPVSDDDTIDVVVAAIRGLLVAAS